VSRHCEQAVVPNPVFAFLALLGFDDADQTDRQDAADDYRGIQEDQDVQRIAVLAHRRRKESEIVRERRAFRHDRGKPEGGAAVVVVIFVRTPLWRFDDGRQVVGGRVQEWTMR
jgi:hypothetical protein